MFLKIVLSAYLISLVKAETIDEAVANLNQQIAKIKTNIGLVQQQNGILISQTRAAMGQAVGLAESQLHTELNKLRAAEDEARHQAEANNVDISSCILALETSLNAINWNKLHLCSKNHELDLIGNDMSELNRIKASLSGSVRRCLGTNADNVEGLKSCVQSDIDNANSQVQQVQSKVHDVCDNAKKGALECVDKALGENQAVIKNAAGNFEQCVGNIL